MCVVLISGGRVAATFCCVFVAFCCQKERRQQRERKAEEGSQIGYKIFDVWRQSQPNASACLALLALPYSACSSLGETVNAITLMASYRQPRCIRPQVSSHR